MNLLVEYKNTSGQVSNVRHDMSRVAFVKHMAMAGQGHRLNPARLFRTLGMFLHYSNYLGRNEFRNNKFSEPPTSLSDPTEKGQFSNLAGKAIADFLSKKIDKSIFTLNYEAVMRLKKLKIKGERPDLMAYTQKSFFAIEAKGRVQTNAGNMKEHKRQAQSGSIKVNYSVACVSYNLFGEVTCKYHDPYDDNVEFDSEALNILSKQYYLDLEQFIDSNNFNYTEAQHGNEAFYEIRLAYRILQKPFLRELPMWPLMWLEMEDVYNPRLIIPKNIRELSARGLSAGTAPFVFNAEPNTYGDANIYIDNDRIGLRINQF